MTLLAQCKPCSQGKYSEESGITSDAECSDCPAGRYGLETGTGLLDGCTQCELGKWSSQVGQQTDVCLNCPEGKYGDHLGIQQANGGEWELYNPVNASAEPTTLRWKVADINGVAQEHSCQPCLRGTWGDTP